jgi:hypothetical protein
MPTLRRTSATLIATAVLAGGAGTVAPAVPAEAVTDATNASTTVTVPALATITSARKAVKKAAAKRKLSRKARNKSLARPMVSRHGWSSAQFSCLSRLWTRESGWNHRARNRYSGAYGIPQAVPGGKMASAGRDWLSNPKTQIKWGLRYIKGRYGSPCAAWAHSRSHGWY